MARCCLSWGRYRGLAGHEEAAAGQLLLKNVFFDTCVYHKPGIELLFKVVPIDNILFASKWSARCAASIHHRPLL